MPDSLPTLTPPQPVYDAMTVLLTAAADYAEKTKAEADAAQALTAAQSNHTAAATDKAKAKEALETAKAAAKTAIDTSFPTT